MLVLWRLGRSGTSQEGRVPPRHGCFEGSYEQEMDSQSSVSPCSRRALFDPLTVVGIATVAHLPRVRVWFVPIAM